MGAGISEHVGWVWRIWEGLGGCRVDLGSFLRMQGGSGGFRMVFGDARWVLGKQDCSGLFRMVFRDAGWFGGMQDGFGWFGMVLGIQDGFFGI